MQNFSIFSLLGQMDHTVHEYQSIFASERLSLALAVWPAGSVDNQQPHEQDEVYYLVSGSGRLQVADEDVAMGPGSTIYVAAGVDHHFHDIMETLEVLIFWAPPRA